MKLKEGFDGNHFDKYSSNNFIIKYIMQKFTKNLDDLIYSLPDKTLFDLGCGEGHWINRYRNKGYKVEGADYSENQQKLAYDIYKIKIKIIDVYNEHFIKNLNQILYKANINNILLSEVLEHLEDPELIIEKLHQLKINNLIITVPNEPIWRILNCLRLKYLRNLGNTPGHINHFSRSKLIDIVKRTGFNIEETIISQPFILLKCTK